jgi:hypothetical protein
MLAVGLFVGRCGTSQDKLEWHDIPMPTDSARSRECRIAGGAFIQNTTELDFKGQITAGLNSEKNFETLLRLD